MHKSIVFELPITTCPRYLKKLNMRLANKYGVQNVHIYDVPRKFIYVINRPLINPPSPPPPPPPSKNT